MQGNCSEDYSDYTCRRQEGQSRNVCGMEGPVEWCRSVGSCDTRWMVSRCGCQMETSGPWTLEDGNLVDVRIVWTLEDAHG